MDKIVKVVKQDCKYDTLYNVTFEQVDGTQYNYYCMSEAQYNYEIFRRKLLDQYNLPKEIIDELESIVENLKSRVLFEEERDNEE